jgi:hypothetical protein
MDDLISSSQMDGHLFVCAACREELNQKYAQYQLTKSPAVRQDRLSVKQSLNKRILIAVIDLDQP